MILFFTTVVSFSNQVNLCQKGRVRDRVRLGGGGVVNRVRNWNRVRAGGEQGYSFENTSPQKKLMEKSPSS